MATQKRAMRGPIQWPADTKRSRRLFCPELALAVYSIDGNSRKPSLSDFLVEPITPTFEKPSGSPVYSTCASRHADIFLKQIA